MLINHIDMKYYFIVSNYCIVYMVGLQPEICWLRVSLLATRCEVAANKLETEQK
jgi:hypothetical protein